MTTTNSLRLTNLFKQAKITANTDALLDSSKKIALKADDVTKLVSTLDGLKPADKQAALDALGYFKDRFDIADVTAKKLFDDKVPTQAPVSGARPRSVATQHAKSMSKPRQATAKDIQQTDAAIDGLAKAGGKGMANEAAAAAEQSFQDGDVKAHPDAQKARTQSKAKRQAAQSAEPQPAPEAPQAQAPQAEAPQAQQAPQAPAQKNSTMALFDQYAKSPFFEDRLMAALGKAGIKFMTDMNQKLASFDDPKREALLRATIKDDMTKMLNMANTLSPDAKRRVATQIQQFAAAGKGADMDASLKAWIANVPKTGADGKAPSPDEILKSLPPPSNAVLQAMSDSPDLSVRGWGAVLQASSSAEQLSVAMDGRDAATISEDEARGLLAKGREFQAQLKGLQSSLPDDVKQQIGDVKLNDLPAAIDPTSRQVMFQQINLMMNQYQQIMQAFSEIINKLNEMAMDPIRKIGR